MNPARESDPPDDVAMPRWVWLHALRITLGRTPIWLTAAALLALLALAAALPTLGWFASTLEHRYEPGSVIAALDETFRFDHRTGRGALDASTSALGAVLALMAMLVGAFTAGGWLQVFLEHTEGHSVLRFFYGGARYFFRFARLLLLTLLTLHLLGWLVYGKPWEWLIVDKCFGFSDGDLHAFESELSARKLGFVQDGLYALGFALVLAWGDYTRTRLAVHGTQSAAWAGLCSWTVLFAHPVRSMRPLVLLWLAEAGVLWLVAMLVEALDDGASTTHWRTLSLFGLGLAVLVWRTITRAARYSACVQVTREIVRPLSRPDPWKRSIGGPGGPRYPIESGELTDGDEYGVSL